MDFQWGRNIDEVKVSKNQEVIPVWINKARGTRTHDAG